MKKFKTPQEEFWYGNFGNDYVDRSKGIKIIVGNISLFSKILKNTINLKSILELGAGSGSNLIAIRTLFPEIRISAVELNRKAIHDLKKIENIKIHETSILNFRSEVKHDLVLTKGVLIHINPQELQKVYRKIYDSSKKYICITEYYNPTPIEVIYRGNKGFLFKRDFAGEMMDKYQDLSLIDYGFSYHRDNNFPQDDFSWFLLEKNKNK